MNIAQPAQAADHLENLALSLIQRIFARPRDRAALDPLYRAIVAAARDPFWYRDGGVPDTIDGRFDMVAALTALVLLRLEAEGDTARDAEVLLTELFIDDMDASLRQIGVGDYVVGKHVGRMMGALGGRLAAFRAAGEGALDEPVRRNVFRDAPPSEENVAVVGARLADFRGRLGETLFADLLTGALPTP